MFHRLTVLSRQSAILLALLLASVMNADARNYALLVGVSNYPNLDKKFQLAGPDNDVRLMKSVLRQLKVEERDIVALFSASDKRPTKANIVAELRQLAAKTTADDFVYLHFAGHGSRQPARAGDTEEEDNLDEIFLPEDVGNWSDEIGAVERAITDNEINQLITAIRAKGTFVWAVFDSCHSGTMLRSVGRIKWRKVDPSALGIPSGRHKKQLRQGRLPSPLDVTAPASPVVSKKTPLTGSIKPGGFVAFYAAQSHELAPELQMPPNALSPLSHGLFSYQLAQAMMGGAGLTYRQLGQVILQKYVTQGMRATTPLFEGTHLDAPMFGRENQQLTKQWPVRIRGSRNRSLFIPAGELQQIGKGAVFALLENVSDSDEKAIGYAKAGLVELFGTQLIPVAHGGKAVFDLAKLPRSAYARIIKPAFQFGLSVAMPSLAEAKTQREVRVAKLIHQMAADQGTGGEKKDKPRNGLQVKWLEAGSAADIHLVFSPPEGSVSQTEGSDCSRNHLWFLDRTGALICSGSKANLSFRLQNPSADFDFNVRRELTKWLNAIGKVRNLEQMVERFKGGRFARKIKIKLMVKKAGESKERIVDQSSRQPLSEGDALRLEISNTSSSPVDLTILFVDSRYGIVSLFPTSGRTNRISAKGKITNIGGKITADTLGLEGMIVIASKAAPGTPVADFRFLAQKKLSRTKNLRALGGATSQPALGAVEELFASAAFGGKRGVSTRSVGKKKKRVRTPFKSVAIKSMRWIVGNK
jgi:Caspase domain